MSGSNSSFSVVSSGELALIPCLDISIPESELSKTISRLSNSLSDGVKLILSEFTFSEFTFKDLFGFGVKSLVSVDDRSLGTNQALVLEFINEICIAYVSCRVPAVRECYNCISALDSMFGCELINILRNDVISDERIDVLCPQNSCLHLISFLVFCVENGIDYLVNYDVDGVCLADLDITADRVLSCIKANLHRCDNLGDSNLIISSGVVHCNLSTLSHPNFPRCPVTLGALRRIEFYSYYMVCFATLSNMRNLVELDVASINSGISCKHYGQELDKCDNFCMLYSSVEESGPFLEDSPDSFTGLQLLKCVQAFIPFTWKANSTFEKLVTSFKKQCNMHLVHTGHVVFNVKSAIKSHPTTFICNMYAGFSTMVDRLDEHSHDIIMCKIVNDVNPTKPNCPIVCHICRRLPRNKRIKFDDYLEVVDDGVAVKSPANRPIVRESKRVIEISISPDTDKKDIVVAMPSGRASAELPFGNSKSEVSNSDPTSGKNSLLSGHASTSDSGALGVIDKKKSVRNRSHRGRGRGRGRGRSRKPKHNRW